MKEQGRATTAVEEDQPDRNREPQGSIEHDNQRRTRARGPELLGLDGSFCGVRNDGHEHAATGVVEHYEYQNVTAIVARKSLKMSIGPRPNCGRTQRGRCQKATSTPRIRVTNSGERSACR